MKPSEIYRHYIGIKAHFTQRNYDWFKYKGAMKNVDPKKRHDLRVFTTLSTKLQDRDVMPFFIAQMLYDPNTWVGNMWSNGVWLPYKKKLLSLSSIFTDDLRTIKAFAEEKDQSVEWVFHRRISELPLIIKLYQQNFIQLETLVLLYRYMHLEANYQDMYTGHILYDELVFKIRKYDVFLKVDPDRFRTILINEFKENS